MKLFLLIVAAMIGGAANALAGGGQFIVFPALLFAGVASVKANATASLAMVPGGIASAWVYRRSFLDKPPGEVRHLIVMSIIGSLAGSILLLSTPNATFSALVPWLLLIAASVFTAAPHLRRAAAKASGSKSMFWLLLGQFIIALYGGYFGAGMGVLMIALFLAAANMDVQSGNGVRLLCGTAINLLAVVVFAIHGAIDWKVGVPMVFAGITGGYLSARGMRRLSEKAARHAILVYAWGLTAWFFLHAG
ncbi:MAG TPA: sulfite exporter TauE/SafE family protein [Bryobacteraceae bacterium]|nr:sulfite exporter TauE/SafE family protein [Bryobacteraceae bacterium]